MLNEKNFREAFDPLHASDETVKEVLKMTQMNEKRRGGWVLRTALVVALVACLMATMTVALAGGNGPGDQAMEYKPFQPGVFTSEEEFLNAIFGLTGYDHVENFMYCDCPDPENHLENHKVEWIYSVDRVALDTEVAQTLKSYITHVGQSMSWNGYTLTIDSMLYDKLTGFGIVSYTFEGPEGAMNFNIDPKGTYSNYYFTPFFGNNLYVADKSTETKVTGIGIFGADAGETHEIEFNFEVEAGMTYNEFIEKITGTVGLKDSADGASEQVRWYDSFEESPHTIEIHAGSPDALEVLTIEEGDMKIELTAISMRYKSVDGEDSEEPRDNSVVIRFADGTEYTVHVEPAWRGTVRNMVLNGLAKRVNMHGEYTNFVFNRLVDLDEVVSVVLDGVEYYVN